LILNEPQPRLPSTLGAVGLGLVVVSIVMFVAAVRNLASQVVVYQGTAWWFMGLMMSCFGGVSGLVVSIVATASKRGRPFGIAGIVLGTASPVLLTLIMRVLMTAG
jgi:riboflavin transporter FmnP